MTTPQRQAPLILIWPWALALALLVLAVVVVVSTSHTPQPASDGFTTLPAKVHAWGADIADHAQNAAEKAVGHG